VNANGTISAGTGFTVIRTSPGFYRISINSATTTPFVTATANDDGPAFVPATASTVEISKVYPGGMDLMTYTGSLQAKSFHFIALVPR
jgi:hypothetical protein